jgi:phage-related tail protein
MSTANSHIGEKMLKATEVLSSLTNEYYDKIHFSEQSRNWVGETQSKYQNM